MVESPKYPVFESSQRAHPHEMYDQMRRDDPICKIYLPQIDTNFWIITRYEDVVAALKHRDFVNDVKNLPPEIAKKYLPSGQNEFIGAITEHLLHMDAPHHTRVRSLVHKAFTPNRVRELQPRIEQVTDELLDAMGESGEVDLIDVFAYPVPITLIAEMLGVELERRDDLKRWTKALLYIQNLESAQASLLEFLQYSNELIEARRKERTEDILSDLVHAQEEDGDRLTHMELMAMIFLLIVAGHETTVNLIANGMLTLLQHPDQLAKLRANPDLIGSAVEEILRYEGPVESSVRRYAAHDVEFGGVVIPQGEVIYPSLRAANRDPEVFENPHIFDITRNPNPHVAFGHGIHYCVGAPLARMEGTIALRKFIERFRHIELAVDPSELQWSQTMLLHGLKTLPIRYSR